jgi:hypothetical protein
MLRRLPVLSEWGLRVLNQVCRVDTVDGSQAYRQGRQPLGRSRRVQ